MNPAQNVKVLNMITPGAIVDNTSWTTEEIDTLGWDYLTVIFQYGTSDIALAALALTESDTTGSGHANITGCVCGTSADIDGTTSVLPSATDDGEIHIFQLDLRYRKRYIDMTATAGDGATGTYAAAVAILSKGQEAPATSAEMGAEHVYRV